jgi:hypothetical protein
MISFLSFFSPFKRGNEKLSAKEQNKKGPKGKILIPLEPSLDHLWGTLFHHLLQMGRVRLKGFCEREEIYNPNGIRTANSVKQNFMLNSRANFQQEIKGDP